MSDLPIIDVRSPAEFKQGHIPGATNIPLFTNEERAAVGTVYKQKTKEKAIELGYTFVTPKLDYFVEASKEITSKNGIVIHCWRGGMRSKAFAEHLANNGIDNVFVIQHGYKAYRRTVIKGFENEYNICILGGYTGSGKTEILAEINEAGEQVIDLEALASHKGSAYGGIGQGTQPSNEHFENMLFWQWKDLDLTRRIWIEDESRNIGNVVLPQYLYNELRGQKLYFINIPREERAKFLVEGYADLDHDELVAATKRIEKRLGGLATKNALEFLEQSAYYKLALLALSYYDKHYTFGLQKRNQKLVHKLELKSTNHKQNAQTILDYVNKYGN
ncbi:MAG: tRNA 2-selenouridine(34) synthase MnmH [Crocinitomicaceae bacterium]|nr:tRNA 2-selenouridine(34) synthase MnmH [Crocinitomicaceae bacterium]